MQRSLCRVKGQNQWSVLSSNCSAPPHPHNFEELGKNWEVAESASERESLQLLRSGVERSILSFSCFTFLAHIQFYFSFFFFFFKFSIETQLKKKKSPGALQLVNVNKRPWQDHINYIGCHAWDLTASNIKELFH